MKKFYLIILLLASALTGFSDNAKAQTKIGSLYYFLNEGRALVTFVPYELSSDEKYSGAIAIPETVTYEGKTYTVTSIGQQAFSGCSGVTSVELPNSIEKIGNYAFSSCTGLTNLKIPDSVIYIEGRSFEGCSGLTSVEIPNSVTYIGYDTFNDCSGLKSVVIGNSVTSISSGAFEGCNSLTQVYFNAIDCQYCLDAFPSSVTNLIIGDQVKKIPNYAFTGLGDLKSVVIGKSVTEIGYEAFGGCGSPNRVDISDLTAWCGISFGEGYYSNPLYYAHNLYLNGELITDLEIPDSITSIKDRAFQGCSMTSVVIPNSVTSIGESAFSDCTGLTSVEIPNSVTSIGGSAFSECRELTSVVIPNSVTSIGDYAFYWCSNLNRVDISNLTAWCGISFGEHDSNPLCYAHNLYLNEELITDLEIPDSITSIKDYSFQGCSMTSVVIPNSVASIGDGAFEDCNALKRVEIGNSVTSIGDGAFEDCDGLKSVEIGNSVTSIGDYAFSDCSSLSEISFPESLTSLGFGAFSYCDALKTIVFNSSELLTLETYVFHRCEEIESVCCNTSIPPVSEDFDVFDSEIYSNATLYIPKDDEDIYKSTTPWSGFLNIKDIDSTSHVENIDLNANDCYTIFNLDGVCIIRNASSEYLRILDPGIYIINGKKVLIP